MCGIAGIVDLRGGHAPERGLLRRMASAVRHRGPDELGLYLDETVGFVHTRLSVIDPTRGQQPLSNEDGSVWITYNGEIYDHVELRSRLEACGHRFHTSSDTEVLLHAVCEWGAEALANVNGQFAFALWDRRKRRLLLARDRFGVRPLHLARHAGRLYFASAASAFFADPTFPRGFDPRGIDEIFTFWATVAPLTPFAGIEELAPGRLLEIDLESGGSQLLPLPERERPPGPASLGLDEAALQLRGELARATRLRIERADVAVGSYLSGGLDSSLIAALAREVRPGHLDTFSVRFDDAEFDETKWQKLVVERLETEHHELRVSARDIARVFPEVVEHAERPLLRTAPAPLYLLSRATRACGTKVVVTGEGADEMLGGYDLFREAKIRAFWARDPDSKLRPRLLERLHPYLRRSPAAAREMARRFFAQGLSETDHPAYSHLPRWRSASALKRLFSRELRETLRDEDPIARLLATLPLDFPSLDLLAKAQHLEVKTLLSGYILSSQGDRALMAHAVEGRFPFLDAGVVAFCSELPARYKLRGLDEKHVLKRAARGLVPDEILARAKQPYRAPDAACFVGGDAPDYVSELLCPEAVSSAGLFDPVAIERLLAKCRSRANEGPLSNADNMALVGVLSSQILWDRLIRSPANLPEAPVEERRAPADRDRDAMAR